MKQDAMQGVSSPSRQLESLTDEELIEISVHVLLVPHHNAWMDIYEIKKFLVDNSAFTIGVSEEEQEHPLNGYEFTPQTFFNLTLWLLERGFQLYNNNQTSQK